MAGTGSPLFQAIGGTAGCRSLAKAFYARVDRDPLLRPLFPGKTLTCAIEEFAAFLVQFLGGPSADSQRRWWLSLRESHGRFPIGRKERDAWLALMLRALDDAGIGEPARGALRSFFTHASAHVVNRGSVPVVAGDGMPAEVAERWGTQCRLEEAAAAVRMGHEESAVGFTEACEPTIAVGLLALMIRQGMSARVGEILARRPALAHERNAGRTLLHTASAAGDLATVELLLRLGADPNGADGGGHTPLYSVANECKVPGAATIVRALVRAGADANAAKGVKRCTPLHMAARRGNVELAEALLECGARLNARDSQGDTPLQRALNCHKPEVVRLLLSRGANSGKASPIAGTPNTDLS